MCRRLIVLTVLFVAGCEYSVLTNARFETHRPTQYTEAQLVSAFARAFSAAGYKWQERPVLRPEWHLYMWSRDRSVPGGALTHSVGFFYRFQGRQNVEFVFYKDRAGDFNATDWEMFFDFRDRIVPQVLPGLERTTTIHPASSTADKDLEALSKISPEPLSATDQERLRKYQHSWHQWFTH